MHRSLLPPLLAVLVLAAGCGGSGGDPEADPAAIVPARAPVYVEAAIGGDDTENLDALAQKLAGVDDVGAELQRLIEREANEGEGEDLSWSEDVEPWIGDRVGFFATSVRAEGGEPTAEGAVVAPTEDADQARDFLERTLEQRDPGEPAPQIADRTHREVDYKVDTRGDTAVAVVEDYAITGSEQAVRQAIETADGEALGETDAFQEARDQVEEERVGFAYVRLSTLFSSLGPQGLAFREVLGQTGDTVAVSLSAEEDEIRVESAALGAREGDGGEGGSGEVLETLPGDAWAAAGTADVGGQLERSLQQFGQLGAFGGFDLDQTLGAIEQQTGIDVRAQLEWMGDAGLFVRGERLSDLGGALVVASSDPQATQDFVPRVGRLIGQAVPGASVRELDRSGVDAGVTVRVPQAPLPIHVAAAGDRFVVAVTDGALDAALEPDGTLADAQAFQDAAGRLEDGVEPSLFVDLAPVRTLLDAAGAFEGAEGARARQVLEALTTVVAGASRDGDVQRGRLVVGVR